MVDYGVCGIVCVGICGFLWQAVLLLLVVKDAMPYLIRVLAMAYSRQGEAIGLGMLELAA